MLTIEDYNDTRPEQYRIRRNKYTVRQLYTLLLILPFFVFSLCARTRFVRSFSYAALFVWNSLPFKHTHSFQIIFEILSLQAILLTLCVCSLPCNRLCSPVWRNNTYKRHYGHHYYYKKTRQHNAYIFSNFASYKRQRGISAIFWRDFTKTCLFPFLCLSVSDNNVCLFVTCKKQIEVPRRVLSPPSFSLSLCVSISVSLSLCLSLCRCLPACLPACLSVCLSVFCFMCSLLASRLAGTDCKNRQLPKILILV